MLLIEKALFSSNYFSRLSVSVTKNVFLCVIYYWLRIKSTKEAAGVWIKPQNYFM